MNTLQGLSHRVSEWAYGSTVAYANPFSDVQVDVVIEDPSGHVWRVPAYWAGGETWRVRFAPRVCGTHRFRTECSDAANGGLHGQEGALEVAMGTPTTAFHRHGTLRVSADHRHLEHTDGTPFFWLGDTWWTSLCTRLPWPEGFQRLGLDRKAKGFSLLQIALGFPPDDAFQGERGRNEAGMPWTDDLTRINPAYFDMADLRLQWLAEQGFALCLVSGWGFALSVVGVDRFRRYWRYLIGRYGAYPVVWCLAGEFSMPYYLSKNRAGDARAQCEGWAQIADYVRATDPWHHPITIHPMAPQHSRATPDMVTRLDFDMIQIGHAGHRSKQFVGPLIDRARRMEPTVPVINAEACYEGIAEICPDRLVRHMFWTSLLRGCCGFTYGANGIWQLNEPGKSYGPSPHGLSWGDQPWTEAMDFPGARQMGLARGLLERYPWWQLAPHPEWLRLAPADYEKAQLDPACCAGIPGGVRLVYFSDPLTATGGLAEHLVGLDAAGRYRAFFFNPKTGQEHDLGVVQPDAEGAWRVPAPPIIMDWVLVLERV